MSEAAPQAAPGETAGTWWCRLCGKRVAAVYGGAVHAATGLVTGLDGHLAAPVDREPPLWKAAREIARDYGGAFDVTARYGYLAAYWSVAATGPGVTAAHYEADSEQEMRGKLDTAVAGTRWAREGTPR